MIKKIFVLFFSLALLFVGVLWIYSINDSTKITVTIQPGSKFSKYKIFFPVVENAKYKTQKEKEVRDNTWVWNKLREKLRDMGLNEYEQDYKQIMSEPPPDSLIVKCYFERGWGLPEPNRDLSFETQFVNKIDMEFIDAQTKKVLIKIAYVKGFADQPYVEMDKIFQEIQKRLNDSGQR